MRKWRYEGGEPPTVKQMRDEIAMDEALEVWEDEHAVRRVLAAHEIGEGLRLAAPMRRRERAMLAWQLQQKELLSKK